MSSNVRNIIAAASLTVFAALIGGGFWFAAKVDAHRDFLFQHFGRGTIGAEIGVWKGEFSDRVLHVVQPSRFHLIDPWKHEDGISYEKAWYGGADSKSGQQNMDAIHDAVIDRFREEISSNAVVIHRAPSAEASNEFSDEYFDWIYIDGNHLYEFVKKDLELYYPKVKSGGYITGDDYGQEGWWEDGVRRAVDEFTASYPVEVISLQNNQFVLRKK